MQQPEVIKLEESVHLSCLQGNPAILIGVETGLGPEMFSKNIKVIF